jgi:hypothetical protein
MPLLSDEQLSGYVSGTFSFKNPIGDIGIAMDGHLGIALLDMEGERVSLRVGVSFNTGVVINRERVSVFLLGTGCEICYKSVDGNTSWSISGINASLPFVDVRINLGM